MERIIYTYALIKSLFDLEEDYLDCFLPFIVKVFTSGKSLNSKEIQKRVKENSNLDIPIHVLNSILYRGTHRGLIKKKDKIYKITDEGIEYINKGETEREVNRRIKSLIEDIKEFFNEKEHTLTSDNIQELICSILNNNIKILVDFINPSNSKAIKIKKPDTNINILVEYIKVAEEKKPQHYETLRDMILGSIISVILRSKKPSKINEMRENWFDCQIYFDSNFIFSLLGLDTPHFNEPAQELFQLLEKHKFELKVFDFTVDEITNVIKRYLQEGNRYPKSVKINTVYKTLNDENWSKSDVIKFITDLEDILNKKGIIIESTGVNLSNYKPKDNGVINKIEKYKLLQSTIGQLHDLAAIEQIKSIRKKSIRKFEDCKALFLSSDGQLSKFNFSEMGHKDHGTICEVMLDRLLTNILWLKDPNADISLKAIMESYSQDLFINKRVWIKFYGVLNELKQEKKINNEDISMLFYHGQVESLLKEIDEKNINQITNELILKEIEKAEKLKKEEMEYIENKDKEFFEQINKERELHNNKIQEIKEGLKKAAEEESNRYAHVITLSIAIVILLLSSFILYELYQFLKQSGDIYLLIILIGFFGVFLTLLGVPTRFQGIYTRTHLFFKNRKYESCYKMKLRDVKLEEIEND